MFMAERVAGAKLPQSADLENRTVQSRRPRREVSGLAAGDVHMPRQRRPLMSAVDDEIMALGLTRDRFFDRGIDEVVTFGGAQRRAQVGGILLAEAHVKRAGAGQPYTI